MGKCNAKWIGLAGLFRWRRAMVTVWGTKPADSTYTAKLEVQLATGERPVIYDGQLTMDN